MSNSTAAQTLVAAHAAYLDAEDAIDATETVAEYTAAVAALAVAHDAYIVAVNDPAVADDDLDALLAFNTWER